MLRNKLYFHLKPFLPQSVRMGVRRWIVFQKLDQVRESWPILPGSEKTPEDWPGWPEAKKFAFVLTHDIESQRGLDRVKQLAELEMSLGFRSSFNFIPDGPYTVPPELRDWLTDRGFEVGVHDLRHDGHLYSSRAAFRARAARINGFARDWGASGFRSAFMLNKLEWLHDLEVDYDASTFDTDPFEPQPEGVGTIFPFWVGAPEGFDGASGRRAGNSNGRTDHPRTNLPAPPRRGAPAHPGYVELPYTLPQDSTLFLIMRERSMETWRRKLDWIVRHGGMALVNIHPDYIDFDGTKNANTYPVDRIRELLEYVTSRHLNEAWCVRATELATWFRATRQKAPSRTSAEIAPRPPTRRALAGKRAAVLLYSYYPADPRPRRAAEALVDMGMKVDLFCLQENKDQPRRETIHGVEVFRTSLRKKRDSKLTYLKQYGQFIAFCFTFLARRSVGRRYDLVHVHNMPDVLVFAALPAKLRGARVMLDLHDPMPELMTSIYRLAADHWFVRALRLLERWSIGFADLALTPNLAFQRLFISRSCRAGKVRIVMNSPESDIFDPDRFAGPDPDGPSESDEEFRIMHHGSIVHRHGVDLLVEAVARVRAEVPGVRLDIYGARTGFLDRVLAVAQRLGLEDRVHFHGPKPQSDIARAIRECHVGVVPNRRSPFTDLNFPTRLFEYLAMRRPVIAPATSGIRDYFGPEELVTFEPDDVEDLARKVLWVKANPEPVAAIVERGRRVYQRNQWRGEKERFLEHVSALLGQKSEERAIPESATTPVETDCEATAEV